MVQYYGMLRSDRDDQLAQIADHIEEEEKKSDPSSEAASEEGSDAPEIEISSNFAFDRFLSLGAYGYANGMIKIVRVTTVKDEVNLDGANR